VGSFEVGKEFDALLIDPHVRESPFFSILGKDSCQVMLPLFTEVYNLNVATVFRYNHKYIYIC